VSRQGVIEGLHHVADVALLLLLDLGDCSILKRIKIRACLETVTIFACVLVVTGIDHAGRAAGAIELIVLYVDGGWRGSTRLWLISYVVDYVVLETRRSEENRPSVYG
jgi:hypothetical protein